MTWLIFTPKVSRTCGGMEPEMSAWPPCRPSPWWRRLNGLRRHNAWAGQKTQREMDHYPRITALLREAGRAVNVKRVEPIWRWED